MRFTIKYYRRIRCTSNQNVLSFSLEVSKLSKYFYCTVPTSVLSTFFFWRSIVLPRDLVPYPPVAPYADPSGDTTRLCLCKHSIDLLSQIEMKLKVYNPGGIGRVRLAERMDSALERRKLYPASEKLQILSSVASLMKKENMTQSQASIALQVCPSQVSRWRACADDLAASVEIEVEPRPNGCP